MTRVYCDMDGVLVDFAAGAKKAFGIDISRDNKKFNQVWDGPNGWQRLQKEWPTFWIDLPPFSYTTRLWNLLNKYHSSILTAYPPGWTSASTGKQIWVNRHLSNFGHTPQQTFHAVKRSDKQRYARSASGQPNILIDDHTKNIQEWNAAGGVGVLFNTSAPNFSTIQSVLNKYME